MSESLGRESPRLQAGEYVKDETPAAYKSAED